MSEAEQQARAMCRQDGFDPDGDWRDVGGTMLAVMVDDPRRWLTYLPKARAVAALRRITDGR